MADRIVRTQLIIDDHGSVKVVKGVGDESLRTEGKLKGLDKQVKGLGKSFGGLKNVIGLGLGAVGVGGLAFGLSDIASKTKEVAAETEKFHTITGIGATQSLQYTQALKARGLSGESVTRAFGFLAKNLKSAELQEQKYATSQATAAAKGKESTAILGRQASALKELGISLSGFGKLSEAGKLQEITKSFEAMAPGIQKTRLERELFGRGGNQLSTVLEHNNLGLSHQIELVKKFFPEIKGGANAMNELLEKQAESKMAWEGLEFTIGQKLIPVMTKLMGAFSSVVVEIEHGKGTWGELGHTFEGIAKFAGGAAGFIKKIGDVLGIHIGSGSLASVLLGIAGLGTVRHPVHAAKGVSGAVGAAKKFGPYLGPATLALGAAYGIGEGANQGIKGVVGAVSPGYLNEHSLAEIQRSYLGGQNTRQGYGRTELQGTPAPIHVKVDTHIDGLKVGEALLKNPRARREIAEASAIYGSVMAARR